MGACFNTKRVTYRTPAELKKWFSNHIEDLLYEKGHDGFNGTFTTNHGLNITNRTFKTEGEADEYISRNTDKRDAVMAVIVGDVSKAFPHTKADIALVARLDATKAEYDSFELDVLARAQAQKSAKKTCAHCGSSVSLKHLSSVKEWRAAKTMPIGTAGGLPGFATWRGKLEQVLTRGPCDCPVCGKNLLITDTDQKRYARLGELVRELNTKVHDATKAWNTRYPNQGYWFLGGWSAEYAALSPAGRSGTSRPCSAD